MAYYIEPLILLKITLPSDGLLADVCDNILTIYAYLLQRELNQKPRIFGHEVRNHTPYASIAEINTMLRRIELYEPDWPRLVGTTYLLIECAARELYQLQVLDDTSMYVFILEGLQITNTLITFVIKMQVVAIDTQYGYCDIALRMHTFKMDNKYPTLRTLPL